MADKKQTKKTQKKKKKWVVLKAPKLFRETVLGESPVYDPESMMGKRIKVNMMTVTRDPKKQNYNVIFEVTSISGGNALTDVVGYEMVSASIKRLVKRRKEKIDDSFVVKDKEGKLIRLKPMLITNGKTNNSVATAIRKKVRYLLSKKMEKQSLEEFMGDVITGKLLKQKDEIKRIFPIKIYELRRIVIEKRKVKPIDPKDYAKPPKKRIVKKNSEQKPESEPEKPNKAE